MDILVSRKEDRFETSVYRKETFTGLGMNFLSFEPMIYKINAIRTLIYRAYHLCSNYLTFDKEILFLFNFFHNNGFPSNLFYKYVRNFLDKQFSNTPKQQTVKKLPVYVSFPYYGYVSERIKAELKTIVCNRFLQIDLRIIFENKFSEG